MGATSRPNREPRSRNAELIGCQSVRLGLSFPGLRTVVRVVEAANRVTICFELGVCRRCPLPGV
jgi:hypothetical protein